MEERKLEIGDVVFEFLKIPPLEAFDIAEHLRVTLERSGVTNLEFEMDDLNNGDGKPKTLSKDFLKVVVKMLSKVDRGDVKLLREMLFKHILFRKKGQPHAQPLLGLEDMAFEGLDFTAVYRVIGKATVINFIQALVEMMSQLGQGQGTTQKS